MKENEFIISGGVLEKYTGTESKVWIPSGIRTIGDSAFSGRCDITEVYLPEGVREIGPDAFESCDNLRKAILPAGLQVIEEEAFWGCRSLTETDFPEELRRLGQGAFYGCPLREIYLPSGIVQSAYELLVGDRYVSLEDQDGYPDFEVFTVDSLENIRVSSQNTKFSSVDGVLFDKEQTKLFCFPPMKACTSYTVSESVAHIETDAFRQCRYLQYLFLPKRLIRPGIITDCPNLVVNGI